MFINSCRQEWKYFLKNKFLRKYICAGRSRASKTALHSWSNRTSRKINGWNGLHFKSPVFRISLDPNFLSSADLICYSFILLSARDIWSFPVSRTHFLQLWLMAGLLNFRIFDNFGFSIFYHRISTRSCI